MGIKTQTTKNPKLPKLPAGIPIFVDPLGMQEAEVSMNSEVKRPSSAVRLHPARTPGKVLDPLGLAYVPKDGFIMITSKASEDRPIGGEAQHPYLDIGMC